MRNRRDESFSEYSEPRKGRRRRRRGRGWLILLLIPLLIVLGGLYLLSRVKGTLREMHEPLPETVVNETGTAEEEGSQSAFPMEEGETESSFNLYISGNDTTGDIDKLSRSDVNIIMTVNFETHRILMTFTPRDYYVPIPGVTGGEPDKLTHAGIYGVDRSVATLEELYGVELPYYARVNFTSLIDLVDVLGGVDVESEQEFDYDGHHYVQGVNHVNGEQALGFARARFDFVDGDHQRGRNEMALMKAILKKCMSPQALLKAPALMDTIATSVSTNLPDSMLTRLIMDQIQSGEDWTFESQQVTGTSAMFPCYSTGAEPLSVVLVDSASVTSAREAMLEALKATE